MFVKPKDMIMQSDRELAEQGKRKIARQSMKLGVNFSDQEFHADDLIAIRQQVKDGSFSA